MSELAKEEQHEDNSQQNDLADVAICHTKTAVCDNEDQEKNYMVNL